MVLKYSGLKDQIQGSFTYHKPFGDQPKRYYGIREIAKSFAEFIDENVPDSQEKSTAITKLQECVMWANAGIAVHEKEDLSEPVPTEGN